ncbi:hypothetical protein K8P10_002098 [Leucobacter sp. Psy1]|uniref:SURF1 family cytochrome oxidase biogenesis protein n=1 Tax=Leucobacter sp. Psy1 TaxID=2875729 RepID=UPI001CD497BA|nr:SURF1 family cytochrome oxidase biogenesis protein [Leucobacter sp. Psy1]UBH06587.1 hypothetical protein K8P10_002098 [Leucobacter sp. Psy1]
MTERQRPQYTGEPTLAQIMRRPVWILALLFALAVAGAFAWLGQWQLSHAIQEDTQQGTDSEVPRPLGELNPPGEPVTDASAGHIVTVDGTWVPDDFAVVSERANDGETGAWVIGHLVAPMGNGTGHLAVAVGWAPTVEEAETARDRITDDIDESRVVSGITGRYMPSEGVSVPAPDADPFALETMAPAQLANIWDGIDDPVWSGFLVLHADGSAAPFDEAGLTALDLDQIDSVPPIPQERVNWLNVFYAVEWVVFAGFAVYFWFRLTRDAWEKEHELRALTAEAEAESAAGGGITTPTRDT